MGCRDKSRIRVARENPLALHESDAIRLRHRGDPRKALDPHPHIADQRAAVLICLFNNNSRSGYLCARGFDQGEQSLERTALGEKVVDDQNPVVRNWR